MVPICHYDCNEFEDIDVEILLACAVCDHLTLESFEIWNSPDTTWMHDL